jgi:TonB-dependent SusC/RagA subfamily outer membrane receptor
MLKHEREHVVARDPLVLLPAGLAVICFPWNAGLWFIAKRLRLAVEIDCDKRVLRAVNRPREYGMLLLAVGARHTAALPYAASLVERTPLLERRIRAMTSVRPRHPVVTSVILGIVAIATTTLAAQAPRPKPFAVKLTNAESSRRAILHRVDVITVPASASTTPSSVVANRVDSVQLDTPTVARTSSPAADSNTSRPIPNWRASLSYTAKPAAPSTEPSVNPISRTAPAASADIPFPVIRDWIARYHPDIVLGQSTTALVTIIVDANDKYVSSTTDATQANPAGKIPVDSIASIDLLKGAAAIAAYGDSAANGVVVVTTKSGNGAATLTNREFTIPKDRLAAGREVNTVSDLVRLRANSSSPLPTTHPLFVIDGVVVDSPDPVARPSDQLDKLGVPSDGIQAVQVLRIRAGQIGPNALSVVVIKLKP